MLTFNYHLFFRLVPNRSSLPKNKATMADWEINQNQPYYLLSDGERVEKGIHQKIPSLYYLCCRAFNPDGFPGYQDCLDRHVLGNDPPVDIAIVATRAPYSKQTKYYPPRINPLQFRVAYLRPSAKINKETPILRMYVSYPATQHDLPGYMLANTPLPIHMHGTQDNNGYTYPLYERMAQLSTQLHIETEKLDYVDIIDNGNQSNTITISLYETETRWMTQLRNCLLRSGSLPRSRYQSDIGWYDPYPYPAGQNRQNYSAKSSRQHRLPDTFT